MAIDPDNMDAVNAFLLCSTQWQHGPTGERIGMHYQGVMVVIAANFKKKRHREIFSAVQIMEFAALEAMNTQSNRYGK